MSPSSHNIIHITLSGGDLIALAGALLRSPLFEAGPPEKISVDDRSKPLADDWLAKYGPVYRRSAKAIWKDGEQQIGVNGHLVALGLRWDTTFTLSDVLDLLRPLEFELASFGPMHSSRAGGGDRYVPPGFGDLHVKLGWGCAFRGAGHRRLVSRRWLEHGPWRLHRAEHDLSLVQFHDLDVDPKTALDQARPGHQRMGISPTGGFLQTGFLYSRPLDGLYDPEERKLTMVIHGREVSQREMLDRCAARLYQPLGSDRIIERVAYMFPDERAARAHLHELWLRELECWTIVEGEETRLDDSYAPSVKKPAWVGQAR